jgi:hypothetical protein
VAGMLQRQRLDPPDQRARRGGGRILVRGGHDPGGPEYAGLGFGVRGTGTRDSQGGGVGSAAHRPIFRPRRAVMSAPPGASDNDKKKRRQQIRGSARSQSWGTGASRAHLSSSSSSPASASRLPAFWSRAAAYAASSAAAAPSAPPPPVAAPPRRGARARRASRVAPSRAAVAGRWADSSSRSRAWRLGRRGLRIKQACGRSGDVTLRVRGWVFLR